MTPIERMREARQRFQAGELILPQVLRIAENAYAELQLLETDDRPAVVVATLQGDVHDIGAALLIAMLSSSGYRVIDLGKQVPIARIIEAVKEHRPAALALSALLVTTSRLMPRCVQALEEHGLHLPVLIGGAAMNRSFGRRAGRLPDGRVYEPAVFYCRDVFEGVAMLDALLDPRESRALIERTRAEIAAEHATTEPASAPDGTTESAPRSAILPVAPPSPPYLGTRHRPARLEDVWQHMDRNTLFRYHWGGFRSSEYASLVADVFEPKLEALQADAIDNGWLEPRIVSGYFRCRAAANQLILLEAGRERARLDFPRQPQGEHLCLADFFGDDDVVVLQAVTVGPRPAADVVALRRAGQFERMLYVNGLASATTEALAEYGHALARRDLGLEPTRGLRFSWGYPACPDLEQQRIVLPLLRTEEEIGLTLSASANLDPEHSTAAMIVHHPAVSYFAVRPAPASPPPP